MIIIASEAKLAGEFNVISMVYVSYVRSKIANIISILPICGRLCRTRLCSPDACILLLLRAKRAFWSVQCADFLYIYICLYIIIFQTVRRAVNVLNVSTCI